MLNDFPIDIGMTQRRATPPPPPPKEELIFHNVNIFNTLHFQLPQFKAKNGSKRPKNVHFLIKNRPFLAPLGPKTYTFEPETTHFNSFRSLFSQGPKHINEQVNPNPKSLPNRVCHWQALEPLDGAYVLIRTTNP